MRNDNASMIPLFLSLSKKGIDQETTLLLPFFFLKASFFFFAAGEVKLSTDNNILPYNHISCKKS